MADSTLSLSYTDFLGEVGYFLNYGYDSDNWSTNEAAQIDRIVQAGYRQFLYPPAIEGVQPGYEWSFLRPVTTIDTVADDMDQDLPDDFGRLVNGFVFELNAQVPAVKADVGEAKIRVLRQNMSESGKPRVAGIRIKAGTGSAGQKKEVLWYPTPDDAYTLSYRYDAFVDKLTEALPYPLGGMKHAQLVLLSCLSAAESLREDTRGVHWDGFVRSLISSIQRDRNEGPKFFGQVGCKGEYEGKVDQSIASDYGLEVSGTTIQ